MTVDCQWSDWSSPTQIDPYTCGDGLQPLRRVGVVTRKHIPYPDGNITGPGGVCHGENITGTVYETKKPWSEDCPGECSK